MPQYAPLWCICRVCKQVQTCLFANPSCQMISFLLFGIGPHFKTNHPYSLICRSQLYRPVPSYDSLQSDIWGESWHVWRGIRVISLLNSCVCCHLRSASPSAAACSANRLPQNMHFKAVLRTKVSQAKLSNQVLWYTRGPLTSSPVLIKVVKYWKSSKYVLLPWCSSKVQQTTSYFAFKHLFKPGCKRDSYLKGKALTKKQKNGFYKEAKKSQNESGSETLRFGVKS